MAVKDEFPENRRDANGVPTPTPLQVREEAILNERIAREKAFYEHGFPVAGHDFAQEAAAKRGR